jgi:hypothetical protein
MLVILACLGLSAASEDEGASCTVTIPGSFASETQLPDPFKKLDGTRITKKADWVCRKEEIRKLAEKYAYGAKGAIPTTTGSVTGGVISISISLSGRSSSFTASISAPAAAAPYPAIIAYGGLAGDTTTIKAAGAAIINYDPYTVGAEGTSRSAKRGVYYTIYGSTSSTGLLAAWAWGVSRIIDVIAASGGTVVKPTGVGVTGCSRFGKGAFVAGALDDRVALTIPIESGTGGAPCWRCIARENGAQPLSNGYSEQPWFGDAFPYSNPTSIPIDTHEVIGLIAPRGLFIQDNPGVDWLGARCGALAGLAGKEIYKALGVADNILYWSDVSNENHCSIRGEWASPTKAFIQKFLLGSGTTDGTFHVSYKKSADLSQWRSWTTPTLE